MTTYRTTTADAAKAIYTDRLVDTTLSERTPSEARLAAAEDQAEAMSLDDLHDLLDIFSIIEAMPVTAHNALMATARAMAVEYLAGETH